MSADNQQERLKFSGWVVGFIDGEGCFSVSVHKSPHTKLGWQVFPEFVVTQGAKSIDTLKEIRDFFGCGNVFVNKRYDNHKENLYRYCVRSINDLRNKIIPFFVKNPLRSAKKYDFDIFRQVMEMVEKDKHLTEKGIREIAKLSQMMNRKKPAKILVSPETIRQTPQKGEDMVPSAWRHAGVILEEEDHPLKLKMRKVISEIPCGVSSHAHEWFNNMGTVSTRGSAKL